MLEKHPDGSAVIVTFRVPREAAAESVCVLGEFNDWEPSAHEMAQDEDGFVAVVALEPGRAYRFRYLLDGQRWENDWAADAYVPNEFGGDDSVVDLTDGAPAKRTRKAKEKADR
jgi:1,4-alpha-glucan branching enzyme